MTCVVEAGTGAVVVERNSWFFEGPGAITVVITDGVASGCRGVVHESEVR